MGDVEKKLSPDGQALGTANACEGFQLHCFPDIAAAGSNPRRASGKDTECFQRSVPGAGDCYCAPPSADIEEPDQVLTVEEAEQLGYDRGLCEGEAKGRAEGQKAGLIEGRQAVQPVIDCADDGSCPQNRRA